MSIRNDVEIEEEKTESSIVQQPPSDEVETDEEGSDYGSTFESFRSKEDDDDQYCLLETEESEKKKMTTSDQQETVEKDEVSSDEAEMDDGSTIGPLRSSTSLSVSECRWGPCLEVEEYDEGIIVFSRSSSSTSSSSSLSPSQFDSSFCRSQPQVHPIKMRRPTFFKNLLGVPRRVIGKPTLITPPRMISYQDEFKIFTKKKLRKVTNYYSWVIGKGGFGGVYKGILDDLRIVAVKRDNFLYVDGYESSKEFVNAKIYILSQINHVNVVKLLGCCLEEEVPMLVYEYIPNGTLFNFIHLKRSVEFPLDTRLRMAAEAAEALAYLHSGASPPILHGDVKSSNILLDENYTVKVNDFGDLANNKGRMGNFTTKLLGTYGYVDPEYCCTGELTDRSDVYSFGVVLLELLTRKMAIYYSGKDGLSCSLAESFVACMMENRLLDIMDPEITTEGLTEQLRKVTNLAAHCSRDKGSDRPAMKEVQKELEASRVSTLHMLRFQDTKESQQMMIPQTSQDHS